MGRAFHEPQRPSRRHQDSKRVGADDSAPLATLILAQTIVSLSISDIDFNRPAIAVRGEEIVNAEGQVGGEKRFDRRLRTRERLRLVLAGVFRLTTTTRMGRPGSTLCQRAIQDCT